MELIFIKKQNKKLYSSFLLPTVYFPKKKKERKKPWFKSTKWKNSRSNSYFKQHAVLRRRINSRAMLPGLWPHPPVWWIHSLYATLGWWSIWQSLDLPGKRVSGGIILTVLAEVGIPTHHDGTEPCLGSWTVTGEGELDSSVHSPLCALPLWMRCNQFASSSCYLSFPPWWTVPWTVNVNNSSPLNGSF